MSGLAPKWLRFVPNETKLVVFKISCMLILSRTDLKKSQICLILGQSDQNCGANPDTPKMDVECSKRELGVEIGRQTDRC